MDEKVILALVATGSAVAGGLITSVVAPIVKHWLERSAVERDRRREQIKRWRSMILEVERLFNESGELGLSLQLHPDFLSLEPHLEGEVQRVAYAPNRTVSLGVHLPHPLQMIKDDIARIEREWGVEK